MRHVPSAADVSDARRGRRGGCPVRWSESAGDDRALAWCERLASCACDAPRSGSSEDRLAQYHAAAVTASNCVVGLVDAAATLMEGAGVERTDALCAPCARCWMPALRMHLQWKRTKR